MQPKKTIMLSHIINTRTPLYAGDKGIFLEKIKSFAKGDYCETMRWSFPNHLGTHLDAPAHFIKGGLTVTDLKPRHLVFNKIKVVKIKDIGCGYIIYPRDFKKISNCELLLIKTDFEKRRGQDSYWNDSPALAPELAQWLKRRCPGLRAIGIDFISVSNLNNRQLGRQAHREFLSRNIFLIEDMRLSKMEAVPNAVIIAPLLVEKADGSPCLVLGLYN